MWKRHDKVVAKGNVLQINQNVTREENGVKFECIASNKHGSNTAESILNVMCKYTILT